MFYHLLHSAKRVTSLGNLKLILPLKVTIVSFVAEAET